jgi:hypothetical protein
LDLRIKAVCVGIPGVAGCFITASRSDKEFNILLAATALAFIAFLIEFSILENARVRHMAFVTFAVAVITGGVWRIVDSHHTIGPIVLVALSFSMLCWFLSSITESGRDLLLERKSRTWNSTIRASYDEDNPSDHFE